MSKEVRNRAVVLDYYERSEEKGYWGFLNGVCHYGYSNENDDEPFNMAEAQYKMEILLGECLNLPPQSKVLDAGCGYGPVARTLTEEFGYDVTGIDLIQDRLNMATRLNNQHEVYPKYTRADYHSLPFADDSFDGVYTMETLVHAQSHTAVLKEFNRILKPGGRITIFEYSIPELTKVPNFARKLATRVIKNTGMTSLPEFTHGSFSQILKNAGFENIVTSDISENIYDSWYYMWRFAIHHTLEEFSKGRIGLDNIPGSMWIWPARKKLGYNICHATKPR